MLFVTLPFLVFFLVVYTVYWVVPPRFRFSVLLASGIVFYGTSSIPFTIHLVLFVWLNHTVIELWRLWPKRWLVYALQTVNVLNIALFKYYYFIYDACGHVLGVHKWMSPNLLLADRLEGREILLPLGISFYTFQVMSYGFDVFRDRYRERHGFHQVLMYALFFPVLIAGPIMRAGQLLPQIMTMGRRLLPDREEFRHALWLIIAGLVKKVLIADRLAPVLFPFLSGHLESVNSPHAWLLALSTSSMLYLDFSAYTDLARGTGLLLGFQVPINFRAPFFMISLGDFWRRWHLTFSHWIKDYIYIPLGGSRVSEPRHYLNFVITFFIGGLWHEASYNFALWGLMMGLWLSVEGFAFRRGWKEWPDRLPGRLVRLGISWFVLLNSSVFFFSPDFSRAVAVFHRMYSMDFSARAVAGLPLVLAGIAGAFFFQSIEEWPERYARLRRFEGWLLPVSLVLVLALMIQYSGGGRDFFYFQF